jgi:hypothetical protein
VEETAEEDAGVNRPNKPVSTCTFQAGSVRFHVDEWENITSDRWVLDIIRDGYRIEFTETPYQWREPSPFSLSSKENEILDNEIHAMWNKGAIEMCTDSPGQFISNMFIVEKAGGKFRPVINLKELNNFVEYHHFKQETFHIMCELVQQDDYFVHLDLSDAYFSIPINIESRKYLRFRWKGQLYQFTCLCFGLASAPRVYTKIMKPVFAWFRFMGIRTSFFIDDSIYLNQLYHRLVEEIHMVMCKLCSLGFFINEGKSVIIPTKIVVHLGFFLNSRKMLVSLPEKKVQKVLHKCREILVAPTLCVREVAQLIGLIVSSFPAVFEGKMHYRFLEREKISALRVHDDFDCEIELSDLAKADIQWWLKNLTNKNGCTIQNYTPDLVIETDASLGGWGAVCQEQSVNGRWSSTEGQFHINYLELLAISLAVRYFCHSATKVNVLVYTDSTTAIAYINHMGGVRSVGLDTLAIDLWEWCSLKQVVLSAVHIPGVDNSLPDFLSRNFDEESDWMLKPVIFDRLCNQLFRPEIDLFASRINSQLHTFVSWRGQPGAWATDAFTLNWSDLIAYAFPPFSVIQRVLHKVCRDEVRDMVIVVPWWQTQVWFPVLLDLLVDYPIVMPRHKDLLTLPHNRQLHPLRNKITLVGCHISGVPWLTKAFRTRLQNTVWPRGGQVRTNNTNTHGKHGVFGQTAGVSIPVTQLKLM